MAAGPRRAESRDEALESLSSPWRARDDRRGGSGLRPV